MNRGDGPGADRDGPGQRAFEADSAQGEVLELDTRLGLEAFGSERRGQPASVEPVLRVVRTQPPNEPIESDDAPDPAPLGPAAVADDSAAPSHDGPSDDDVHAAGAPAVERRGWVLPPPALPRRRSTLSSAPRWIVPATVLVIVAIIGGSIWAQRRPSSRAAPAGELTIDTTPPGARVIIGGRDRGRTPLSLTLAPGTYEVEVRAGDERHVLPVRVTGGTTTTQHVFLRQPGNSSGTLRVTSDPPAAAVAVDGRSRGTTPVLITDLAAGPHDIVVTGTSGQVRQRVVVDPDATTTVMVPLQNVAPQQGAGGWLSIHSPTELQVFEQGRLLGTTRVDRLMLTTGPHTLRLSNDAAAVDVTRQVTIARGQMVHLQVALAPGTLSINALPWANVAIDGHDVGETPLGDVELSPGPHEVVFTHPELGERRQQVTIRSGGGTRVSVDLRR